MYDMHISINFAKFNSSVSESESENVFAQPYKQLAGIFLVLVSSELNTFMKDLNT